MTQYVLLELPVSYVMGTELEEDCDEEVEVEEMMNVEKESIGVCLGWRLCEGGYDE